MTKVSTKPICLLGRPCLEPDCDYCDEGKLAAVRRSARSAFFPVPDGRRVLAAAPSWILPEIDSSTLPLEFADVCKLAKLQRESILAGGCLEYRPKNCDGYFMGWMFILDLPRECNAALVGRQLKSACIEVMGKRDFCWSFAEIGCRKDFDLALDCLFSWSRDQLEDDLAVTPRRDAGAIDCFLNSVQSSARIYAQNLDRTADGLFLPSPYKSAE